MALTKKQRAALKEAGLDASGLKKLEAVLAEDDADEDNGDKPSGSKRVLVYEGDDAESFMRGLIGGSSDDDGDDGDDDDDDEGDDKPESDDKPKGRTKWFG